MKIRIRNTAIIIALTTALFFNFQSSAFSQFGRTTGGVSKFYFDAVVFSGGIGSEARIDFYILVPFQSLRFEKANDVFASKYALEFIFVDSTGNKVLSKIVEKKIIAKNYYISQGGEGSFDYTQKIFELAPGEYKVKIKLIDKLNDNVYERSRTITVLDFSKYGFSLSGILLVSSIEEINGKYKITPHVSDNIANLKDGYFAFFEVNNFSGQKTVDFDYKIIDNDKKTIFKSDKTTAKLNGFINQQYLKIAPVPSMVTGSYTLIITAYMHINNLDEQPDEVLAITKRSIRYIQSISGNVKADINKAIRQLRYVATQSEIDFIEEGATTEEKQERFEDFWKKLDPTPNTEKNEAFDEYYGRIEYANKKFKSYTEGWRTDMGKVYVIFGQPINIDRREYPGNGNIMELWQYYGNREFLFSDNSGFGDFRLIRPYAVTEKYKFNR